ncbi:MAG: site-2 protease family protein [Acetobacteraceae bacterium]|nr:site-2 protease family protein [Acetobacteraceae bacterium]
MLGVLELVLAVIAAVLAITLHEAAHGYAALALGDDTARLAGRLSLNPLRHVDRVGTVLLPGFLLLSQLLLTGRIMFMFGWAKPVPVAAWKFRDPFRGMMVVAAAGPAMNFFLSWLAAVVLHGVDVLPTGAAEATALFLQLFILSNLVLGLFNLLPIPPLDGGRILLGLLPRRWAMRWAPLERSGLVIVLLLIFVLPALLRSFGIAFNPISDGLLRVVAWAGRIILVLAGYNPDEIDAAGATI